MRKIGRNPAKSVYVTEAEPALPKARRARRGFARAFGLHDPDLEWRRSGAACSPPSGGRRTTSQAVDLNLLCFLTALATCLLTLARTVLSGGRTRATWVRPVVFAVTAVLCYLLVPELGGYLALVPLFVGGVLPGVMIRRVQRHALAGEWARAERLARHVAWWLRSPDWRVETELLRALHEWDLGRERDAIARLERLGAEPSSRALRARCALHVFRRDWALLREELERTWPVRPEHAYFYARALSEQGDVEQLVQLVAALDLAPMQYSVQRDRVRLLAFSAAGREPPVRLLLDGPLRELPPIARRRCEATLARARGQYGLARRALDEALELARSHRALSAELQEQRQALSGLPRPIELSPDSEAQLDRSERLLRVEQALGLLRGSRPGWAPITTALVALNVLAFAVELATGDATDSLVLLSLGAFVPEAVLEGEWWRFGSWMFLHAGAAHLTLNLVALAFFGPPLERYLGWFGFPVVYLGAGLIAALVELGVHLLTPSDVTLVMVGASACVLGLVGARGTALFQARRRERVEMARPELVLIVFAVAFQLFADPLVGTNALVPHATGFVAGAALGWFVLPRTRSR